LDRSIVIRASRSIEKLSILKIEPNLFWGFHEIIQSFPIPGFPFYVRISTDLISPKGSHISIATERIFTDLKQYRSLPLDQFKLCCLRVLSPPFSKQSPLFNIAT
jgi:hypothetical protein